MAPPGGGPTARQGERKQSMPHNQRQNAQNALNVSMRQGATIQPNHEMNEKRGGDQSQPKKSTQRQNLVSNYDPRFKSPNV